MRCGLHLAKYINDLQPGGVRSANQQFLKTFTYMEWRRYSGLSHGASEAFIGMLGMVPIGAYFMDDFRERVGYGISLMILTTCLCPHI